MSDLPIAIGHVEKLSMRTWLIVCLLALGLSTISWGLEDTIFIGSANGLQVQTAFTNIESVGPDGAFVFPLGGMVSYRVIVKNRANSSFGGLQVQSSLHSDGATCGSQVIHSEELLPGASVSAPHTMNLDPLDSQDFEQTYVIPKDLCASQSHLKIRLTYMYQNRMQATELISPLHFRFESAQKP